MLKSTAYFSKDRVYRYQLIRRWSKSGPLLPIVMLNPSIANEEILDPTITRCVQYAKREGFSGLVVGNLYALVSTFPVAIKKHDNPIGNLNYKALAKIAKYAASRNIPVLCAWGTLGSIRNGDVVAKHIFKKYSVNMVCLGINADGSPKHPLYQRKDQEFLEFYWKENAMKKECLTR